MHHRVCFIVVLIFAPAVMAQNAWEQAAANGAQARQALLACWRYSQGWLQFADPATGLLPRRLNKDLYWNAQDCAADNYPFLILTAFFTDPEQVSGRFLKILETEQRLCNRVDRLPDDWDFATQAFRTPEWDMDRLIFGASEYVKDGLIPVTEWVGPSAWSERMLGLLDDIWKNAGIDTEVGKLPSTSHEVSGEMMQSLSRMYWMTRKKAYKDEAYKLASFYLDFHLPTEEKELRLDDHGCEVLGGLSEVYFLAMHEEPEKREQWRAPMQRMLDRVLEVGRDDTGLFYMVVNPRKGKIVNEERTDNWGYNYNAFATVAMIDDVPRYHNAIRHVLSELMKNKDYPWEGAHADGFADSLEGCLNLMNRYPEPAAFAWADYTAERLLAVQRDTGIFEGWYGDGNSARTLIMYALWKTQGAYLQPWRADLRLGAAVDDEGYTCFVAQSDWTWNGKLHFDVPRHSEYLNMPADYARLNQFPEWFVVSKSARYQGAPESQAPVETDADDLRAGLTVHLESDKPFRIRVRKIE